MIQKYFKIIQEFKQKEGHYILFANIGGKLLSFITSIIIVRLLGTASFGKLTYALSIIAFIVPFSGLGLQKSFMRFAPTLNSTEEIDLLFKKTFKKGILYTSILIGTILLLSQIFQAQLLEGTLLYLQIIVFMLLSLFCLELISSFLLTQHKNKQYALVQFLNPFIFLISTLLVVPIFKSYGYAILLPIIPLSTFIISVFLFANKNLISQKNSPFVFPKKYLKYGIHTGFGGILSELLFAIDILMLGYLLKSPSEIAIYKVAILIPLNVLIIPLSYINTEFTTIAQEYKNKDFLSNYVSNFFKLFSVIVFALSAILIPFGELWLTLIFGEKYSAGDTVFMITSIGIIGGILFRVPFGNINSAIGKAHWNTYNALFIILFNSVLNYSLIQHYGITGAAITTAISLWLSGLISFALFRRYLTSLPIA